MSSAAAEGEAMPEAGARASSAQPRAVGLCRTRPFMLLLLLAVLMTSERLHAVAARRAAPVWMHHFHH